MEFDLTGEEARLLLETALMATGQNHFHSAATILQALDVFRPGEESLDVAKAVLCISQLQFRECVEFIDGVALPRHPDSGMLRAFRGMALLRLNRVAEAIPSLREAAASQDGAAARLAADMLADVR